MTILAAALPGPEPVETIRTVLKRDVAAVLRVNLPALALVPRDKVYDRVMDDPALLHQAFTLFRARPELFAAVVRTRAESYPETDSDALWCGRTLAEVVALVVRACARRYFRRRQPTNVLAKPRPAPEPGLLTRLGQALGLAHPQPRAKARGPRPLSRGERLFEAMRTVLLFDWQVPLIPAYAQLPPETVTKIGPRLLEFRRAEQIAVLTDPVAAAQVAGGKTPLMLDGAGRLMVTNGTGINAEVLWTLSQKMQINLLFPEWDTNEMRRAVSMVSATAPAALQLLSSAFKDDVRGFALFLFTAYGKMGSVGYKQVFAPNGQIWVVKALAERTTREPPTAPSLDQMKRMMERLLDGAALDDAIKRPPAG